MVSSSEIEDRKAPESVEKTMPTEDNAKTNDTAPSRPSLLSQLRKGLERFY